MLAYEWRELENLCERLGTLRERHDYAARSKNTGLVAGLSNELTQAHRRREQLVLQISTRLAAHSAHEKPKQDASGFPETMIGFDR